MPVFKQTYPDIDIELISTDRNVDHRLEGVDVSIRIEAQLNDQLIARKIASLPFIFCAAPAYLARAGIPKTPEDLSQHACLVFRYPTDGRFLPWTFMVNGQPVNTKLNPEFISDDIDIIAKVHTKASEWELPCGWRAIVCSAVARVVVSVALFHAGSR